ncbi:sensor histidine kinase [Anaeromicropila populeti]|uniref:histidine kinase n=1 Tax=Anaeromicropila populeti TaxID=37658 RepID=A0A1I6J7V6_9FIRM|nr:HAMP domain-containing sensor histidine kinase [Anaeromicropila populeti]SFR75001.1 Signal transduction histidine kinase [Anaeromicropila populeti]
MEKSKSVPSRWIGILLTYAVIAATAGMVVYISGQLWSNYYHSYETYISERNAIFEGGFIFLFVGATAVLGILALLLFCIPILQIGTKKTKNIPVELTIAIAIYMIPFAQMLAELTIYYVDGRLTRELYEGNLPMDVAEILAEVLCYMSWAVYLGICFFLCVSILQVFRKGIKRFLYENSILIKCLLFTKKTIVKGIQRFGKINYADSLVKNIIKVLVINYIVLFLICCTWVTGFFLLVIYSVVLFFLLHKYLGDIEKKYQELLGAVNKMAEGNLEVSLETDLGWFQPIGDSLMEVKNGFKKAVEEEVKSEKMRSELITNISHDLKTPLTAMITYVNLLQQENITEDQREEYIHTLDQKSQRLKRLIEDLFDVSKLNSNTVELQWMEVDIIALMKQVQHELGEGFQQADIELKYQLPEEKIWMELDSQKTYRIFENLFVNIIKYSMPQTRAYVVVQEREAEVWITIKNISKTELDFKPDEVVERFVRGDKSRNTEGSGLGLAIVESLMKIQNGKFEIQLDGDLFKTILVFKKNSHI